MSAFTRPALAFAVLVAAGVAAGAWQDLSVRPNLDSRRGLDEWTLDGSGTWNISEGTLILSKPGTPAGPIRRPSALAILKSAPFTRVTVEANIRSTAAENVLQRDLEFVVGYESPTRFYYVHLAGVTDAVHNGIFLVADADRRRIDAGTGIPQLKDRNWHKVRLERDGSTGRFQVYVDGAATPVLQAIDTSIRAGRVGLGSFDDTGEFRDVVVTGTPAR